jgi:FlaA1/EpsC-like NDP-sugar epimerase
MSIRNLIKKILLFIFSKRPVYTTANIVTLAPNELLKGRCALITGGTSGIGFCIAKAFLDSGATVIITGRNNEKLKASCEKLAEVHKEVI